MKQCHEAAPKECVLRRKLMWKKKTQDGTVSAVADTKQSLKSFFVCKGVRMTEGEKMVAGEKKGKAKYL